MTKNIIPYDKTNTENEPWLLNINIDESILDINGEKLTAEYIWSKDGEERNKLVQYVFEYYRKRGFPYLSLTTNELYDAYQKLTNKNSVDVYNSMDHMIKNSNSTCTDVIKHFCSDKIALSKGDLRKSASCHEVFHDDERLLQVLRNRMGYCVSKEDGRERPYVFNITDKMILQGMRSSGLAYNVSTFKPLVAKFINEYIVNLILQKNPDQTEFKYFDYSAGWGARLLGCKSISEHSISYTGIDPYTHINVSDMIKFYKFNKKVKNDIVIDGCSEDEKIYDNINKNSYDFSWSSPPYFTLETYGTEEQERNQSIILYPDYNQWLVEYWDKTVKNIKKHVLRKNSNTYFGLVMVDKLKKYNISDDMNEIIKNNNFDLIDVIPFGTSKNHLSGKAKTKSVVKNSEKVFIYKNKV